MYTGTCLRPSWTAMVWPIISGMIVERRLHVRITRFSFFSFRASIFSTRWSSTKGPFLRLRAISDHLRPFFVRRRTMYLFDGFFFLRVRDSGLPHGLTGLRPPEDLPSPPPSG